MTSSSNKSSEDRNLDFAELRLVSSVSQAIEKVVEAAFRQNRDLFVHEITKCIKEAGLAQASLDPSVGIAEAGWLS